MAAHMPIHSEAAQSLALALVSASEAPLLLIDDHFALVAASASFCREFHIDPASAVGRRVFELGDGRWDTPQLRALLAATLTAPEQAEALEMDLAVDGRETRRLVVSASRLDYGDTRNIRLIMTVADVTDARSVARLAQETLRQKGVLFQELQHRVANSLQIIASIIMQSARRASSDEARSHLHDAHGRVLSVASLQEQLAASSMEDVEMNVYLTKLCGSLATLMISDRNQLSLVVEADDSRAKADDSVSIGLMVTELVINALKHAFTDRQHGRIVVGYHADGPDWTLTVSDDGVGMPVDKTTLKPGLGSYIIEALARQVRARLEVVDLDHGTCVRLSHKDGVGDSEDGGSGYGTQATVEVGAV
jgi:two-component sensor histidine kinase